MVGQNYSLRFLILSILFMISGQVDSWADEWNISRILDGMALKTIGSESLAMRDSGNPAIAFNGDHLYYATHNGSTWSAATIVDQTPDAGITAVAFNDAGFPFIAYCNEKDGVMKVAYQHLTWPIGIAWSIDTIGPADNSPYIAPSIAIDSLGYPHVAYMNHLGDLAYAYKAADGWHAPETVDADIEYLDDAPSLALTSDNQPSIAYTVYASLAPMEPLGKVRYAQRRCDGPTGCRWEMEEVKEVENDMWNAYGTSQAHLKIDATNRPHVFWVLQTAASEYRQVLHYSKPAESWQDMYLDTSYEWKSSFVVQQDSSGGFHLCWKENETDRIVYQNPSGNSSFLSESLPDASRLSMALTAENTPLVAFTSEFVHGLASQLNILQAEGTVEMSWKTSGFGNHDLEVDSLGRPHIAYYDSVSREIRLIDYDASNWTNGLVSKGVSVNGDLALALSPNGRPNIAYIDADADDVMLRRYACNNSLCFWSSFLVDTAGGNVVNLEMDADNIPHLSYQRGNELLYAYLSGSTFQILTPVSGTTGVNKNSMVLSAGGTPKIAYLQDYKNIYVANRICGLGLCLWDTMGPVNAVDYDAFYLTLQLDSASNPHIAATEAGFDYFWFDGNSWNSRRITDEISPFSSSNIDFCLGPSDQPHFIFIPDPNEGQYALKYTTRYNIKNYLLWYTTTIQSFDYAAYPRIKADQAGQAHVIFLGKGNDLMYAVKKNASEKKPNIAPVLELLLL